MPKKLSSSTLWYILLKYLKLLFSSWLSNAIPFHQDYIRTGAHCLSNNSMLITGSYDHTVKLWDLRLKECTLSVDHGDPVESVLLYPNCGMCISAGKHLLQECIRRSAIIAMCLIMICLSLVNTIILFLQEGMSLCAFSICCVSCISNQIQVAFAV